MSLDNVQLWFAKDKNGKIVTINEVDKENKDKYYCPLCNSEVLARTGEINSWCFAHIDKSKCSSESMYHFWIKNKLLQKGDKFKIQTDEEKEYICDEILVEETYKIGDKEYRPDLTVKTTQGDIIYFEMNYTNEKKLEDYLDTWIGLGNIVVEVDVKTLINSESGRLPIFKAKYYDGKCFNVKKGEDKIYHKTIGEYKEKLIRNNEYDNEKKKEIEKLDWFWKDVQRYKMNEVDIEYMSQLITSVENDKSKDIIIKILKTTSCNKILKDYMENVRNKIFQIFNNSNNIKNITLEFYKSPTIYGRIYGYNYFSLYYLNKCMYHRAEINAKNFKQDIKNMIDNIKNYEQNFKIFKNLKKYIEDKFIKEDKKYLNIEITNYPYLNYYKSYSEKSLLYQNRLYLNDFPNQIYGEYLTVPMCNNFEKLEEFLVYKLGDRFINSNVALKQADKICNNLKKNAKCNLTFKYNKINDILTVRVKYKQYSRYIKYALKDFIESKHINNDIENKYLSMYEQRKENLLSKRFNNKIDRIVYEINVKYDTYVQGGWKIENNNNSINLFKNNLHMSYIDEITMSDKVVKKDLEDKISKTIRNIIYSK
ncbi:competence protein CoiA family protein [Clostridium botulinum]|uniref:competence protein CoiA family protein n=1 Tax=Clostridium botulinum TaxID=1491 RepID=UPI001C9A81BF|nr:competence protein CoiA family protein [Clostridium botulinum]MBY6842784.1 hypothetical protein [Clostridium botulinum]